MRASVHETTTESYTSIINNNIPNKNICYEGLYFNRPFGINLFIYKDKVGNHDFNENMYQYTKLASFILNF